MLWYIISDNVHYNTHVMIIPFSLQRKAIESVPPLPVIFKELSEAGAYENYSEAIELLYWVLLRLRDPHIKSVQKECVSIICAVKKIPRN